MGFPTIVALVALSSATVRLDYAASPPGCPDEEEFRALVAARLGRDPFSLDGAPSLSVRFAAGDPLVAQLLLTRSDGTSGGERRIEAGAASCNELARSVAVAAALALDPLLRREAERQAAPPEAAPVPVSAPPPPDAPRPSPEPLQLALFAGPLGALGAGPALAYGGWLEVSGRLGRGALSVEGRFHAPSSVAVGSGWAEASSTLLVVAPCLRLDPLALCATAALGGLRLSGEGLTAAAAQTVPHLELGLRAAAEWRVAGAWGLRLQGEAAVPLTRTSMAFGEEVVWRVPPVTGHLGAGVGYHF